MVNRERFTAFIDEDDIIKVDTYNSIINEVVLSIGKIEIYIPSREKAEELARNILKKLKKE